MKELINKSRAPTFEIFGTADPRDGNIRRAPPTVERWSGGAVEQLMCISCALERARGERPLSRGGTVSGWPCTWTCRHSVQRARRARRTGRRGGRTTFRRHRNTRGETKTKRNGKKKKNKWKTTKHTSTCLSQGWPVSRARFLLDSPSLARSGARIEMHMHRKNERKKKK